MLLRTAVLMGVVSAALGAAEHRGTVKSGGLPIPGVSIVARQGDQKVLTSTDESGSYLIPNLGPGAWTVEAEITGFWPAVRQVPDGLTPSSIEIELKLLTARELAEAAKATVPAAARPEPAKAEAARAEPSKAEPSKPEPAKAEASKPSPAKAEVAAAKPRGERTVQAAGQRGRAGQQATGARQQDSGAFQRLEVVQTAQSEIAAAMNSQPAEISAPSMSENANESFLVNGSLSRGLQSPGGMDEVFGPMMEMRERMEQMRAMGGMPGGPGGMMGGPGGDGGQGGGPGGMRGGMGGAGGGGPMMGGGGPMMGGRGMGAPGGGPGGFGGRGGPGRGGPGADGRGPQARRLPGGTTSFGNRNNRGRESYHGGASFSLRNSAFDAKPYSITGQNLDKPSYASSRFSLMAGGPLRIPKIFTDEKTMIFGSYFGTRSRNPYDALATLPSALERSGDFSQSVARVPVTVFDPSTSQPFPGNLIPASRIDPAASSLISLMPVTNQPGQVQNYRILTSVPSNSDNFSLRLSRSITRKDRLSGSFNMQRRNSSNRQLYGFRDTSSGSGMSSDVSWSHTIAAGFFSNTRFSFSRNSNASLPYFAYGQNWAADLGILGTSTDPRNFGPPNLSFTNFGGLTDGSPSSMHNQTASFGESVTRSKGKHTRTFGFDYRRVQLNSVSDQNARGSYTFTGLSTSGFDAGGFPMANTGFDFADFLLGLPQSSSIRFGSSDVYFRNSAYNVFLQDDWRVRSNLSINGGLRYEYLVPMHEKYGRMANLDIAPLFTGVAVVTPAVSGPYTGSFPEGMVNPDKNNVAPRIGIAWRPIKGRQTQVRAGYGWYFNGSVYNGAASRMAQQPPFAKSSSVNTSTARTLTIRDGFLAGSTKEITNTFAIDRFYNVGYAQTWNLAIQQDLPKSLTMEVGYLGTKGTRLDILRMPNRAAPGSPLTAEQRRLIGNATGFTFETADGNSVFHAGQLRVMRRFRRGISANAFYTYGKSIDNASNVGGGGGGGSVAQDDHDLRAERAVSSFSRRHTLNTSFMISTSAGRGTSALSRNPFLKDFSLSGGITVASGSHFTPTVLGNLSDTGGSGSIGSGRADATGLPLYNGVGFFSPLAFALPPSGRFGNASRNVITGPSTASMNLSFGRNIQFGDTRRAIDLRVEANNLLNAVNITRIGTTVNSSNFGRALDAANMRSVNLNLRFRF